MYLKSLETVGFKSFAKKSEFLFTSSITAIVGPNGSGKSNVAEAFRFVLGEQSMKSLRGKRGEDLIFSGTDGAPRANRASARIVFDNRPYKRGVAGEKKRLLSLEYDEVSLERSVYRDGTNEYKINGSIVRLRDILELLAEANIGATGHHIISQGEADRILASSPRERKAMIEDALGLKVYQYKKTESEKKLAKTNENKAQVESLRRENAPHLRFLERQMQKLQRAKELRETLKGVYAEYLKREQVYLSHSREVLARERSDADAKLFSIQQDIERAKEALASGDRHDQKSEELLALERDIAEVRAKKDDSMRALGRLEGEIVSEERRIERLMSTATDERPIPLKEVEQFSHEVREKLSAVDISNQSAVRVFFEYLTHSLAQFIEVYKGSAPDTREEERELTHLRTKHNTLTDEVRILREREEALQKTYQTLQVSIESDRSEEREVERELFSLMNTETAMRGELEKLEARERMLAREEGAWKQELTEAGALLSGDALYYKTVELLDEAGNQLSEEVVYREEREVQENRRRELEKLKIRLEELGGAHASDIEKEYEDAKERDLFLEKEITDLEEASKSLGELIARLERELNEKFKEGIQTIGREFHTFFTLMFGGGSAGLSIVQSIKRRRVIDPLLEESDGEAEDEEEGEEGVEVSLSLPNKRIKGLTMLSGGERALVSIALIFAMSRVNPPPFIILDETDAALDEANSRRYGDMIEALAKDSQLILITHNRETMSRAGILYGVTMGGDGISKLLSVKLEEGVAFAK